MADAKRKSDAPSDEAKPRVKLSREERLSLIMSMKGMWAGQLEQYGGEEEFIRKLRSDEGFGPS